MMSTLSKPLEMAMKVTDTLGSFLRTAPQTTHAKTIYTLTEELGYHGAGPGGLPFVQRVPYVLEEELVSRCL
jgi:hypothetical protein